MARERSRLRMMTPTVCGVSSATRARSAPERVALAWTEALTLVTEGVSDEVHAQAAAKFSERELAYLSSAIASINVWNRLGVASRWTPPARQKAVAAAAT
jgi:alkylhydroperoxidase family enzyme